MCIIFLNNFFHIYALIVKEKQLVYSTAIGDWATGHLLVGEWSSLFIPLSPPPAHWTT